MSERQSYFKTWKLVVISMIGCVLLFLCLINTVGRESVMTLVLFEPCVLNATLISNLQSKDNNVVINSLAILEGRGNRGGEKRARQLLDTKEHWINGALYLSRFKDKASIPFLIKGLRQVSAVGLYPKIARRLHDLTGEYHGEDFAQWRNWWIQMHPDSTFDFDSYLTIPFARSDVPNDDKLDQLSVAQLLEFGNQERSAGNHEAAISLYNRAIMLAPDEPDSYTMRGFAYREKRKYHEAFADFNKAVQLGPDMSVYRNNLANILVSLGKVQEAIVQYDEAIRLNPNDISAHIDRGKLRQSQGDFNGAIFDFSKAESLCRSYKMIYSIEGWSIDERPYIYSLLADTKLQLKDFNGAVDAYTRALELCPKFPQAYERRARAKEALGNNSGAAEDRAKAKQMRDMACRGGQGQGGQGGQRLKLENGLEPNEETQKQTR